MINLNKQIKIVAMILLAGQSFQIFAMQKTMQGNLVDAVRAKDYAKAVALVKEGASKEEMRIALNWAADMPEGEAINKIIRLFVTQDVEVNDALGTAALRGNLWLCRFLIEQGIDANIAYRKTPTATPPLEWALSGSISAFFKRLVIEILITTISKKEREAIEQSRRGIMTGLMAMGRGEPVLSRDVRKIIAGKVVAPFVDKHMAYAKRQLDDIVDLAESEQSPWRESSYALNVINPIKKPDNWQRLRNTVEANVRRILFGNQEGVN